MFIQDCLHKEPRAVTISSGISNTHA